MNGSVIGFGFLLSLWSQVRAFAIQFASIFVVRAICQHEAGRAVRGYCWRNLNPAPFGERSFSTRSVYVRSRRKRESAMAEVMGFQSRIFWKRDGWMIRFLLVSCGNRSWSADESRRKETDGYDTVTLWFIRGMWDLDQLLLDSVSQMIGVVGNALTKSRFSVHVYRGMRERKGGDQGGGSSPTIARELPFAGEDRILGFDRDDIGDASDQLQGLRGLYYPEYVDAAVTDVRRWLDSKEWYERKQIPWRHGWLLYGPPGTGKTSLVRAIAQDMGLPVFSFHLASLSNEEMVRYWNEIQTHTPCIALLEDVDVVFDGRENRLGDQGGGLTFDTLLNCLSGIEVCHGVFTVVTTNRIDCIDSALGVPTQDGFGEASQISTRPGRIDRAIHLGAMTVRDRERLARRILEDCPGRIPELVAEGDGDTPAQFQERCAKVALDHHWRAAEPPAVTVFDQAALEKIRSQIEANPIPASHGFGVDPDSGRLVKW